MKRLSSWIRRQRSRKVRRPASSRTPTRSTRLQRSLFRSLESLEDRVLLSFGSLVQVSNQSPFTNLSDLTGQSGTNSLNSEVEPSVAVDPRNPQHLVGVWQQDRWSNGGSRGIVAGVSTDGGNTWTDIPLPGATVNTGGTALRASDPWVSIGPDGTVYADYLEINDPNLSNPLGLFVSTSTNGGFTWASPVSVITNPGDNNIFDDKNSITANPKVAGEAYAVWDRLNLSGNLGPAMFSKTTDGGHTWSTPQAIYNPTNGQTIGNILEVLPNGVLVDVTLHDDYASNTDTVVALQSLDDGATWSGPITVSGVPFVGTRDPDTGAVIRAGGDLPAAAVDPNDGNLYVAWQQKNGSGYGQIVLSTSVSGGTTWSAPVKVNQTPTNIPAVDQQAFMPSVALAANGELAVSYYDFRNNTTATGASTDYWIAYANPAAGPLSFGNEQRLTNNSFDIEQAPNASGLMLGDYQGLVRGGGTFDSFTAFFAQAVQAPADPTSMFARVAIPPSLFGSPISVSGLTPWPNTSDLNGQTGTNYLHAEVEPNLAVDPRNPLHLAGAWQQDRFSDGGSRGIVVGVTTDGGNSWTDVAIPGVSFASGGTIPRGSDPWVSFSPNGDLYVITLSATSINGPDERMYVSKSTDGGFTWGAPTALIADTDPHVFDDKETVTADPTNSQYVYATWDRLVYDTNYNFVNGPAWFSRSTDGGHTWEAARPIYNGATNTQTLSNQILVLPNGTLLDEFVYFDYNANTTNLELIRSTDHGVTWSSSPTVIAADQDIGVTDPDTGAGVRTGSGEVPSFTIDQRTGNLYAAWADGRFSGGAHADIAYTMSTDGGVTWTTPVKVNQTPANIPASDQQAFTPTVAVAANGEIAVSYYDFRNNDPSPGLLTDRWIVFADPSAPTVFGHEQRLTPTSFNEELAANAFGYFLGDYEGMVAGGISFNTFSNFFGQTVSAQNPSNIFFEDVAPPHVFVVTNTTDDAVNPAVGSLRWAINQANSDPGPDSIYFDITPGGVQTITPVTALPTLTDTVTIDGTSQPGFAGTPIIEFDGAAAGGSANGLVITAANCLVKGLVINRFGGEGVDITGAGATGNQIQGDYIGTDVTGTVALGNGDNGVKVSAGATGNTIGGSTAAARNIISANAQRGVFLTGSGTNANLVSGNYIGTNAAGQAGIPNLVGVTINAGASHNIIGTNGDGQGDAFEGNVISGNLNQGVNITGAGTDYNVVAGNYIGVAADGTSALSNSAAGIGAGSGIRLLNSPQFTRIGTDGNGVSDNLERNVIDGGTAGINIYDSSNNVVAGNYIGTDATGMVALGNDYDGIQIAAVNLGTTNNRIGVNSADPDAAAERNVIAGNGFAGMAFDKAHNQFGPGGYDGIYLVSPSAGLLATNNVIAGNYIGINASGTAALGNAEAGIYVAGAQGTLIGTNADGQGDALERNVISGNAQWGIILDGSFLTTGTVVAGNYIGTDATGTVALGNTGPGIQISNGASNNAIGGTAPAAGNVIAFNAGAGVAVTGASLGNAIRGNSIHDNGGLGIDLGNDGVTINDPGDADTGPDTLQNFPVLGHVVLGANTTIGGMLNSTANTQFSLDFYASATADPSGYGQGARYLGSTTVTTDNNGHATFSVILNAATSAGEVISATATDPAGNTSEFCYTATYGSLVQVSGVTPWSNTSDTTGQSGTNYLNAEVEPQIAVDPNNPLHLVGVWQQDRWSNGGSRGIVAGISTDGGNTWTDVPLPGVTLASGGSALRASDPWVSIGPDGTVYAAYLELDDPNLANPRGVFISTSTDGGFHWNSPVAAITNPGDPNLFDDKDAITANPTKAGEAYVVWDRLNFSANSGPAMFSKTTDGGQTWSTPQAIYDPTGPSGAQTIGNVLQVLPNGVLVDVTLHNDYQTNADTIEIVRSTDDGVTWSGPITVSAVHWSGVSDPDTGAGVRTGGDLPEMAVDPHDGNLYVVWGDDGRFNGHASIAFSMSTDGGLTWSSPIQANQTPTNIPVGDQLAFTPSVAVAANGEVAVSYYDFRNNTTDPGLLTDAWIAYADPTQPTISFGSEQRLTLKSFNLELAANAGGYMLGDYSGLVAGGVSFNSFGAFFAETISAQDPSSIVFRNVVPPNVVPVTRLVVSVPSTAAAGQPFAVTVTAVDPSGDPVTNYTGTVHFSSTDLQSVLPADYTYLPSDQGTHTFQVTLKTAGSQSLAVSAPADGLTASTSLNVAPAAANSLTMSGVPASTTAGSAISFTVTLYDPYGNIATGTTDTVAFGSSDATAQLPSDYTFTAADHGVHTFSATLYTAGSQVVLTVDTLGFQDSASINVLPGAAASLVLDVPGSTVAGTPLTVHVSAFDAYGNAATGYTGTVHFTSSDGQAALPADYTFVAADHGTHDFTATLKTAGLQSLNVSDSGDSLSDTSTVNVSPAAASTLIVAGYPSPTVAGVSHTFTVAAQDPYGNTATGYTGTVHFNSSDGQAALPADYTFVAADNGVHTFSATFKTAATQSLTATDTVTGSIKGTQTGIVVNPAAASTLIVAGYVSPTVAGVSHTFTVTARDAFGNTATGYTGTVHFNSSDGQAALPADYTFVAADNGVHTFSATFKTAATQSLTATDTVTASLNGTQTGIVVNAAATAAFLVAGYPSPTAAGTAHSFTGTTQDAFGNFTTDYRGTVHFTSSDGQAVLPADYTFVAADNGVHTFSATFKTAGTQSLTATDTVTGSIKGTQTGVNVTPAAANALIVSGYPSPSIAGVNQPFTVTARDAFGNTATGYRGTVHFTSSDAQAMLPANYTFVAADNGVHTFSATFKTAATQSLTATDTVTGSIKGTQTGIVVNPAAASTLIVAGYVSPTVAGVSHTFTVTARDAFGNTATGYTGTVHFTSSDGQAALPADYTFVAADNGVHTFSATFKTAATQSLTATDTVTGSIKGTQTGIVVNAAATAAFLVAGYPSPTVAGVSHSFTVTARDAFGNLTTGYRGTVHFTSSDAQATLPANYAFVAADNGVHTFSATLKSAGTQSLTATDTVTGSITGTQSGISVTGAAARTLVVAGYPSPTVAGVSHTFTVTARDAFGNTATGYTGTVHFTSSDGQTALPGNYTFVAADNGVHTFSATFKTAATQSLTATDTVTGSIKGTQTGIVVNPAAASTLIVAGYVSPTVAGVSHTFTVTARDAFGNTATGYTGTVHFTSSDGQAALPADYTFVAADNGVHTFSATFKTAATQSLTATDTVTGSIKGTQTGIVVNPAAASTLVVSGYPSPALPNVSHSFTVTAKDPYGNIATGYRGTVAFTSSDPLALLPKTYGFTAADAGVHVFAATFKTLGTQSLTATDKGNVSITGTQSGIVISTTAPAAVVIAGPISTGQTGASGTSPRTVSSPSTSTSGLQIPTSAAPSIGEWLTPANVATTGSSDRTLLALADLTDPASALDLTEAVDYLAASAWANG